MSLIQNRVSKHICPCSARAMNSLYFAGFALALAGGVLLITPPITVYACTGSARCNDGPPMVVPTGSTCCNCVVYHFVLYLPFCG